MNLKNTFPQAYYTPMQQHLVENISVEEFLNAMKIVFTDKFVAFDPYFKHIFGTTEKVLSTMYACGDAYLCTKIAEAHSLGLFKKNSDW